MPAARSMAGGPSRFMNTASIGWSEASAGRQAMSSAATSSDDVSSGVLNTTSWASTSASSARIRMARPYWSASALAIMSTGLPTLASGGNSGRSRAAVASSSGGTIRPFGSQASAARMPGPPPFVTIATRRPRNGRCDRRTLARSSISSIDSARMIPACSSRADTTVSPDARAAVCDAAARLPASVRPAFTATIGIRRLTCWAIRTRERASGIDSR